MSTPESPASPAPEVTPEAAAYQRLQFEQRHRAGSGWFYWIAGLSLINTAAHLAGSTWQFLAGLGLTTFAEFVALEAGKDGSPVGNFLKAVAFCFALFMAGFFILCGVMARKGRGWAYALGMAVYALDAVVLLLFQEWFGLAFHFWALFQLWQGWGACKALRALPPLTPPSVGEPEAEPAGA